MASAPSPSLAQRPCLVAAPLRISSFRGHIIAPSLPTSSSQPSKRMRICAAYAEETSSAPPPQPRQPPEGEDRVGVLLLNLGGPETLDDVQPFLYNLFADPDIIRLPPPAQFLQPAIAQLVSTLRAPKSREGYEAIGGGSPLRKITQEQAEALEAALASKGSPARTYVAMRYWKPFTGASVEFPFSVSASNVSPHHTYRGSHGCAES